MTALLISTIKVTHPEKFKQYMARTLEVARPYGAELMFRGTRSSTLNGSETNGDLIVIAKFPDLEALQRWNDSAEYQSIVALRDASSDQVMTVYVPLETAKNRTDQASVGNA